MTTKKGAPPHDMTGLRMLIVGSLEEGIGVLGPMPCVSGV